VSSVVLPLSWHASAREAEAAHPEMQLTLRAERVQQRCVAALQQLRARRMARLVWRQQEEPESGEQVHVPPALASIAPIAPILPLHTLLQDALQVRRTLDAACMQATAQ